MRRLLVLPVAVLLFGLGGPAGAIDAPHRFIPGYNENDCSPCHGAHTANFTPTQICLQCHSEVPTLVPATVVNTHASTITGSSKFDYWLECTACHNPHWQRQDQFWGTTYGKYIDDYIVETITVTDLTKSPPEPVTKFISSGLVRFMGPTDVNGTIVWDFVHDDPYTASVCRTCHTLTNHHRNEWLTTIPAPGGQDHNNGAQCTVCHMHGNGFAPLGGPHPQANTDCSNCHLNQSTGEPDIQTLHGNRCELCHVSGFVEETFTFLGPRGTWNQECTACHNPNISQTGNLQTPTKGHRCIACHGEQRGTSDRQGIHYRHADKANCVVCHGFVPDTGVAIGSGNRDNCMLCHGGRYAGADIQRLHKEMVPEGLSCIECHRDGRPPVDVVVGVPVGSSEHVCRICHDSRNPSEFSRNSERLHEKHIDKSMDCGFCHADANLQDDRFPMPPVDDARRSLVNRAGFSECVLCHEGGKRADITKVHEKHVANMWQWCFNCHEGDDLRPLGLMPPVTQPKEACSLCHDSKRFSDRFPYEIHKKHASKNKCYACHQGVPPLFDWPKDWLATSTSSSYWWMPRH